MSGIVVMGAAAFVYSVQQTRGAIRDLFPHGLTSEEMANPRRRRRLRNSSSRIRLYVWKVPEGGIVQQWYAPDEVFLKGTIFFMFGRCGGGYLPFGKLDAKYREEIENCARRAEELYGMPVDVIWSAPPALPA
jgi:hypothetical protein